MTKLTYQDAGVNIDAGNKLVDKIKPLAKRTMRPEILGSIGGFNALCEIPLHRYREPVLVSGTDGVGTKLKLALDLKQHSTIGIDLVAMCVNDVIVCGAEPLFFLDYFATSQLDIAIAEQVISGIAQGCELAGAALVGGETAEMPGLYQNEDYDLAGFCVGIVEKNQIIDGKTVKPGDHVIGFASSGPHSNGYSLIRKILEVNQTSLTTKLEGKTLGEILLTPTRIYVKTVLQLMKQFPIKALAHITGGGLLENIPRVIPKDCAINIHSQHIKRQPIFSWLQTQGDIANEEMWRTFNNGVGMVLVVDAKIAEVVITTAKNLGEEAWLIGVVVAADAEQPVVRMCDD